MFRNELVILSRYLYDRLVQETARCVIMLQQFLNLGPELLILPAGGVQESSPLGRMFQLGSSIE
jgi:hypothetical protein